MTTWTSEDREEAYKRLSDKIVKQVEDAAKPPVVIVDGGASYVEPIPFAGMVDTRDWAEIADDDEARYQASRGNTDGVRWTGD